MTPESPDRHFHAASSSASSPLGPEARAVLGAVPNVLFVTDGRGRIVWTSPRLRRRTGRSAEDLQETVLADLCADGDTRPQTALAAAREGGELTSVELSLRGADGEALACTFTGQRLPGENGTGDVVLGLGRTTTLAEQDVHALRRERDRLAALYSGHPSPAAHYRVRDQEAIVQGVNTAFERVFGVPEEKIVGRDLDTFIAPEKWAIQAEALTQQAVEQGSVQAEVVRETEGGPRHFRLNSVLFSEGPQPEGYAIYTDITEQKERERTLREEQVALRAMYRVTADQEASFDEKIQQLINLGCRYLEMPYGFLARIEEGTQRIVQAAGAHPQLRPGATCPLSESYCRRTIQQDSLQAVQNAPDEGWTDDPAYERFRLGAYIGTKIVVEGTVYGTLCFASQEPREAPFSERERTFLELMTRWATYELERQHARAQLERRNERLDSFASLVTHDLRNPLNVAKGRLALAQKENAPSHLPAVDRALDRMDEIIEDVLALTRGRQDIDADELVPCSLSEVADTCWTHVDTGSATLQVDRAPVVEAKASRLQQLLENLFRNAIEHGGDAVTLRVGRLDDGFFVEDDGRGIPEEKREKVLEDGYSSEDDGTGLGLSIVTSVANAHGWALSVTEGRDGGARFEFTGVEICD